MNQKGITLFDVLVGLACAGVVSLGINQAMNVLNRGNFSLIERMGMNNSLLNASTFMIQSGRLAEDCEKRDEDSNGVFELVCFINRGGIEEIRMWVDTMNKNFLVQRKVAGGWVTELTYPKVTDLIICDDDDLKNDAADPTGNFCQVRDKDFSKLYARSHPGVSSKFFRFQLLSRSSNPQVGSQSLQGSFFIRNSVGYPNINRYVWGWTDAGPTN